MEHYHKHVFFVDAGVTIAEGNEINALQGRYGFSDEMRKLLFIQTQNPIIHSRQESAQAGCLTKTAVQWYVFDGVDDRWDIIERNEDCILSDYLFVFAQDDLGNQYAEVTKGKRKGQVIWLNTWYYADADSLEEWVEERLEQTGASPLWSDDELIFNLLYAEGQIVEMKASSLELFLC